MKRFKSLDEAERAFEQAQSREEVGDVLRQVQKQRRSLLGRLIRGQPLPESRVRMVAALNAAMARFPPLPDSGRNSPAETETIENGGAPEESEVAT